MVLSVRLVSLQDMTLTETNPTSASACYAVQVEGILQGTSYLSGETIEQTITVDTVERIAKGTVISYDTTSGVIRYSQDSTNTDVDGNLYRFAGTTTIKGVTSQLECNSYNFWWNHSLIFHLLLDTQYHKSRLTLD